jgi:SHS family lactate transporter-like MFS transporter
LQVAIAESHRNDYGLALAIVVAASAIAITLLAAFGPERHGVSMGDPRGAEAPAAPAATPSAGFAR